MDIETDMNVHGYNSVSFYLTHTTVEESMASLPSLSES